MDEAGGGRTDVFPGMGAVGHFRGCLVLRDWSENAANEEERGSEDVSDGVVVIGAYIAGLDELLGRDMGGGMGDVDVLVD